MININNILTSIGQSLEFITKLTKAAAARESTIGRIANTEALKDIKIDNKNVTVVKLDLNEEDYLNDGIHLSKSGSDKLLDTIKKTLK